MHIQVAGSGFVVVSGGKERRGTEGEGTGEGMCGFDQNTLHSCIKFSNNKKHYCQLKKKKLIAGDSRLCQSDS